MSKEHYEAMATALRLVSGLPDTDIDTYVVCCRALATVLARENPRFDWDRWMQACAPKS